MHKVHNCYTTLMNRTHESVRTFFSKLGLEPEIADIYLALYSHGPQTISELSRNSGVERTRIYRLLDELTESNLIEIESHTKRGILKAAPISNLAILISKKEQEVKNLQDELSLFEQVLAHNALNSPATKVQSYKGLEGIRQMFWNQTRAKSEIVAILHKNIQFTTDMRYYERWIARCNERDIRFRTVFDDSFVEGQKKWNATHNTEKLKHWQGRYFSPELFTINHNVNIYDNVVATYSWHGDEIFGIETYNGDIANTHRQFFTMLWQQSEPLQVQKPDTTP